MYEWKIIDGGIPFLSEFPQMYTINEQPACFWNIVDGDLPFRPSGYPQMYIVTEVPISFWRIKDGDLPYRPPGFPEMLRITEFPCCYWGIKDGGLPYRMQFPPMPDPPKMWGPLVKILLKEMHNSPVLLKTQKSQDVQIGDTTIPHQITKRLFEGIDWELI